MHQRQSRSEVRIGKVLIEAAQLSARKHTFINNVLGRQRTDIEGIYTEWQDSAFDALSYLIKLGLK